MIKPLTQITLWSSFAVAQMIVVSILTRPVLTYIETCTSTRPTLAGVSRPWQRRHGRDIQINANRLYLMKAGLHAIPCCGQVVGWQYQASARAQIRPIEFMVWRQVPGKNNVHKLIGRSAHWYRKDKSRSIKIDLHDDNSIPVKEGDFIGWHSPKGDVVDYSPSQSSSLTLVFELDITSSIQTGQEVDFTMSLTLNRTYGVQAMLHSVLSPEFYHSPTRLSLKCPLPAESHITTIQARILGHEKVTYAIYGYNPWFSIDMISGEMTSVLALHGNFTHDVTVTAKSACDSSSHLTLTIHCIDISSTSPENCIELTQRYHVAFLESETTEKVLFNANEETEKFVYCTIFHSEPEIASDIIYTSGLSLLIHSKHQVLFNQTRNITVNLKCFYSHGQYESIEVVIHVLKNRLPTVTNLPDTLEISSKRNMDDMIFQVNASDPENDKLSYSMNCSCPFSIDDEGIVVVFEDLRGTKSNSFTLMIFVSDSMQTAGPFHLHITISDPNQAPRFVKLPRQIIIPEGSVGKLFQISVTDPDDGDILMVKWRWLDSEAANYFVFNVTFLEIFVKDGTALDYETFWLKYESMPTFELELSVTDGALTSDTECLQIVIQNVNESPVFTQNTIELSCYEGQTGSIVDSNTLSKLASDPDIDDILYFQLIPTEMSSKFVCNKSSGELQFSLDYDTDPAHFPGNLELQARVLDQEGLYDTLNISLTIINVNKAPVISAPSSVFYPENVQGGSLIFFTYVYDEDTTDSPNISIVCTSGSGHLFDIDIVEGAVYLKQNETFDYETASWHTFHVTAFDGLAFSLPAFINVSIINVNEAPQPVKDKVIIESFALEKGDILFEDLRSLFSDVDGDVLDLSLPHSLFPVMIDSHSNTLTLKLSENFKVLRSDSPKIYEFEIIAKDVGELKCQIQIELKMFYQNSQPELVNLPSKIDILENEFEVGDVIFKVLFQDKDEEDNVILVWSVQQQKPTQEASQFTLNRTNGEISLLWCPPLPFGQNSHTTMTITAFDGQLNSDAAILDITINGQNDPPHFLSDVFKISLNESQIETPVFILGAHFVIDPDPDEVLTLSMIQKEGFADHLKVLESFNGQLRINDEYDIDIPGTPPVLYIGLKVTDRGGLTDEALLEIEITDINDNAPLVENDGATFFLPQFVYPGLRIGQIQAKDIDSGLNGKLSFQLVGSSLNETSQFFAISRDSGWLVSTGQYPPEDWTSLYIAVSDQGLPSPIITMTVVNVIARTDNDTGEVFAQHLNESKGNKKANNIDYKPERKTAILILIALCCLLLAVAIGFGYLLWKTKKKFSNANPSIQQAHHEFRFPWIPRQIGTEDDPTTSNAQSSSFSGTSVVNPNFSYQPAVLHQEASTSFRENTDNNFIFAHDTEFPTRGEESNIKCESKDLKLQTNKTMQKASLNDVVHEDFFDHCL